MEWFLLALLGPLMYALSNHIDKILLSKYFKEGGVGTLILFSSLFALLVLPFIYMADKTVIEIGDIRSVLVLTAVGVMNVLVLWCWFMALKTEEASVGVVFYQLVPVFGCILGYFVLGEELTAMQIIAVAIVIFGTLIISFEIGGDKKVKFRWKTVVLMTTAAFFWAAGAVLFKAVALEEQLWRTIFWEHLTLGAVGVGIFVFMPSYRKHFLLVIKENSKGILGLNGVNESLFVFGNIAYSIAYMMAPIGLVLLAESFQPFFVFAIGTFLTVFFPSIVRERIRARDLVQKALAVCVTGFGVYLLK